MTSHLSTESSERTNIAKATASTTFCCSINICIHENIYMTYLSKHMKLRPKYFAASITFQSL